MGHATDKDSPPLLKAAIAAAVVAGVLVLWSLNRGGDEEPLRLIQPKPVQPVHLQWTNPEMEPATLTNGLDRLAVMESFANLDSRVAKECVPPLKLNQSWFQSDVHFKTASAFLESMSAYQSPKHLQEFIAAVEAFLSSNESSAALEKLKTFPGSAPFLDSRQNADLLSATRQIAIRRLRQLEMLAQTGTLKPLLANGFTAQLSAAGVDVTSTNNVPTELQAILRYWELTGTRYLLCQTGSARAGEIVRAMYPGTFRPVYRNAPNLVLDPVHRRFQVLTTFQVESPISGASLTLKQSPDGPLALMTFSGALPRAKLYADWQETDNESAAKKIVFSESFLPELRIILHQAKFPDPQEPAATDKLPPIVISKFASKKVQLTIPALEHNAVLMLNVPHHANWRANFGGREVKIIRANLDACAVYLEPSTEIRVLEFTNHR